MKLELPRALEATLVSTNPIENVMGSVRAFNRRVRRWRDGEMIERWTILALVEAERKFRRIKEHSGMSKLIDALSAFDAHDASPLATAAEAA